ncbi:MAG: hypothetical protein ACREFQ_16140 [Stellaceae bacterium]
MKDFASRIYAAVHKGQIKEPFGAQEVSRACSGWAERTYGVFLPKHVVGNGKTTELFERVSPGRYRTLRRLQSN